MLNCTCRRRGFLTGVAILGFLALVLLFAGQSTGAHAFQPFTPSFTVTADEIAPGDPSVLPVDDDCPVGALCKFLGRIFIPDGQPGTSVSFGLTAPGFLNILSDADIPDGAVVGREFGSGRVGLPGLCVGGGGPILNFDRLTLEATTDPSTTTGNPFDLVSFDRWPSQLNGARDDFIAANPGAVLFRRAVDRGGEVDSVTNRLKFKFLDGSVRQLRVRGNPLTPPTFESCGPIDVSGISLPLTADNPDTSDDEGGVLLLVCLSPGLKSITENFDRADTPPGDVVSLVDTVNCSANTPAGMGVSVPLNGGTDVVGGLLVTFSEVTSEGTTTVVTTTSGPSAPPAFRVVGLLGGAPLYYDISTTATFTGNVEVCIRYDDTGLTTPEELDLMLEQTPDGITFTDRTTFIDTVENIICGIATSFSVWAVMAPAPIGGIVELLAGPSDAAAGGSDSSSARDYAAVVAAAVAAGVLVLAAGAWYARRRWLS